MPSMAPVHALGLAELDPGMAAQRLGQPLAKTWRVQASYKRNAVQIGLPVEHGAKDTAPCLELEREVRALLPFHPQLPHLRAELLSQ